MFKIRFSIRTALICTTLVAVCLAVCMSATQLMDLAARIATSEDQPLAYVGNISFGDATQCSAGFEIPVSFEGGKWTENSAIVPYYITTQVDGRNIDIAVTTSVATSSWEYSRTTITVPRGAVGNYLIDYRDPNGVRTMIGNVKIPVANGG